MSDQEKQTTSTGKSSKGRSRDAGKPIRVPAQFSFVCESLDGKLCLFEDAEGHYTVVRTERLA